MELRSRALIFALPKQPPHLHFLLRDLNSSPDNRLDVLEGDFELIDVFERFHYRGMASLRRQPSSVWILLSSS